MPYPKSRHGGIGSHWGLKIPCCKKRVGSSPTGGIHNKNQMTIVAYIFIGIGLFLTFIMWRLWSAWNKQSKVIEELGLTEDEYNNDMSRLLKKIMFCYTVAMLIKIFL